MSKIFVITVGIFMLLSLSVVSGESDRKDVTDSFSNVPQSDDFDDLLSAQQFYGLGERPSNFDSADEGKMRLGKNFEQSKERRQTNEWNRPQRALKNTKVGEKCCTGMWGRSLRRNKNGPVRKSSINGFESSKSITESASSSAGLQATSGLGKNFEKPKERRQTSEWSRPQRALKNAEVGEKCCTGMWGRSLRHNKNGSIRKSSLNGFKSSKSVTRNLLLQQD